jgi:hypothetical protein
MATDFPNWELATQKLGTIPMAYTAPSITTSGASFANLQSNGLSGALELLIAAQAATSAPTVAATLTASGSGNTLQANTYYVVVTETNGIGETTASPASSSQVVTSGQKMTVTFQTLKSGNVARNVYIGTSSGGPFTLYATGIASATFDCTVAIPSNSYAVNPPTMNTTGLTFTDANSKVQNQPLSLIRSAKDGNLEDVYRAAARVINTFLRGDPIAFPGVIQKLRHAHTAIAALDKLLSDIGTLIDANAGTLGTTTTGIGHQIRKRTWP